MKNTEKTFDTEFLALLLIKQLYADKMINDATYQVIRKKYIKKGDVNE